MDLPTCLNIAFILFFGKNILRFFVYGSLGESNWLPFVLVNTLVPSAGFRFMEMP